jgi:hypothetical protein
VVTRVKDIAAALEVSHVSASGLDQLGMLEQLRLESPVSAHVQRVLTHPAAVAD